MAAILGAAILMVWHDQSRAAPLPSSYSPLTSQTHRRDIDCALKDNPDLLARLTLPQLKGRIPMRDVKGEDMAGHSMLGVNAFADLQGDGKLEDITVLASLHEPRRETSVFVYQDGWPTQGLTQYGMSDALGFYATGLQILHIAVDDLNGDGVDDLVFTDYGEEDWITYGYLQKGALAVALSNGKGGKYTYTRLDAPKNLYEDSVTVDIDMDGDKDIVAVGPSFPNGKNKPWVVVMENDGHGNFTYSPKLSMMGVSTWAIGAGDVDGDGIADLLLAEADHSPKKSGTPTLHIYWGGLKPSKPTDVKIKIGNGVNSVSFADIDHDGSNDIVFDASNAKADENLITVVKMKGRKPTGQYLYHKSSVMGGFFTFPDLVWCGNGLYSFFPSISQFREIPKTQ